MSATELSRLLAAERAVRSPEGAVDTGLSRFADALASQSPPLPVESSALQLGLSGLPKWVGVGFLVGATGAGIASQVTLPDEPGRAQPAIPAPMPNASALAPSVPRALETPIVTPTTSADGALAPRAGQTAVTSPSLAASAPASFDEELRLLSAAKRDMGRGQAHLALAWLGEHRQRFPQGVFSVDREALSILARCQQLKQPELARSFARQHPESPLTAQLIKQCAERAADSSPPANAPGTPGEPTHE